MIDIFISYSQQDTERVLPIAEALTELGWSVFWDRTIPVGSAWADTIGTKLDSARCVLVIWSESSIRSQWVLAEARKGLERKVLIPVCIEDVDPPLPFGEIQHANLVGWCGEPQAPEFGRISSAVSEKVRKGHQGPITEPALVENDATGAAPSGASLKADTSEDEEPRHGSTRNTESSNVTVDQRKRPILIVGLGLAAVFGFAVFVLYEGTSEQEIPGEKADFNVVESKCSQARNLSDLENLDDFRDCLRNGTPGPEMVVIRPTTGSAISTPFAIGRYEITMEEFQIFCRSSTLACAETDPQPKLPVSSVSWFDAREFVKWLSSQIGAEYRLPSAVEWDYAARAGTTTNYWWGNYLNSNKANCKDCGSVWSGKQAAPVGSFGANIFGLYDTTGNLWEWTQDCRETEPGSGEDSCTQRVVKGGSWKTSLKWGRDPKSTIENFFKPEIKLGDLGFRVARDLN